MSDKKILLSIKDLVVKFNVRGRILTAIRKTSLDIYENESIAIVGESGSGKSVFTKTFAGMLDSNGFIDHGDIIYSDSELSKTTVLKTKATMRYLKFINKNIINDTHLLKGSEIYNQIEAKKQEYKELKVLTKEEEEEFQQKLDDMLYEKAELYNYKQTLDTKKERKKINQTNNKIKGFEKDIKKLKHDRKNLIKKHQQAFSANKEYQENFKAEMQKLKKDYKLLTSKANRKDQLSDELIKQADIITKEIYLSIGRYHPLQRIKVIYKLLRLFKKAFLKGADFSDENNLNQIFDKVAFRVKYLSEDEKALHGTCILNLSKVRYAGDWQQIRGSRIATVFQDPMTSLNPVLTIGKQISSIIMKHQKVSEIEARKRAVELMLKVGIPDAESRYDDYPFQYSGGMRQRIVIAIALSCQPKILICDEPTTALDVTIQAQILKLIKDLQKEFNYTIVFITHDLGVVANVAERVAVMYAGQIVEVGTIDEVFYDPRHPYTWALFSSLPQLADKNSALYSIEGTPPSLYNRIIGDPFAPRNPYAMKIDTLKEPPMFKITDTHYAKTWLLDPRSPKTEKPDAIKNIHDTLVRVFNVTEE